jgi:putative aldouronate transport system substrate-binding protein
MLKVVNGIEGMDYKLEDGKYISMLGENETLAAKYPITNKLEF